VSASPVGLQVSSYGKCQIQNVTWASNLSSDNMITNLHNTTKSAPYSLTGDTRIVSAGIVVEQSLVIQITKICDQPVDSIQDPLQCPENVPTFDFNLTMYLPYYAATDEFSSVVENQLNSFTSYHGAHHISSCSLSDAEVYSFASYHPDWFKYKSCTNDGKLKLLQC
jgi:hypothetical protein